MSPDVTLRDLGLEPPAPRPSVTRRSDPPLQAESPGFGFQPGLEGMRGLAVLAVLFFHGGFAWAVGGFLGVSTFFTLSGFLITSLLLVERHRHGRIDLKRFWGRRFRRLMPASLVCLAGVCVFAVTVATPGQLLQLRGDMFAALFYVANWRFIASGQSYAELFAAPSPVLHFWSLAIEEQFYLLFPLLVAGIMVAWRSRRVLAGVLGAATVGSIAYMAFLSGHAVDTAYYSTFSRAGELLIGALLALLVGVPAVRRRLIQPSTRTALGVLGGVAVAVCLWLWHVAEQPDPALYRGVITGYAVLTGVLILAVIESPLWKRVFSNQALRWLGRISYGAYLYHWPIFLWLTPLRTGLSEWPLFVLRMAVTLAVATVSYHLIEQPVRTGRWLTGRQPFIVAPLAVSLLAVGVIRVTADPPVDDVISFAAVDQPDTPAFDPTETVAEAPPPPPPVVTTVPPDLSKYEIPPAPAIPAPPNLAPGGKPRIYLAGDSSIFTLGVGLQNWAKDTGAASVWDAGKLGCGVGQGGVYEYVGNVESFQPYCPGVPQEWYKAVRDIRPHVVAIMFGVWDVTNRKLEGDDQWRSVGDPLYDQYLRKQLTEAIDTLQGQGATVVLMTHPLIRTGITEQLPGPFPESDPERMHRLNELLTEVSSTRPRTMVLDLAGHLAARPNGEIDLSERPDGIHWTPSSARDLSDWLGPLLVDIAHGNPPGPDVIIASGG